MFPETIGPSPLMQGGTEGRNGIATQHPSPNVSATAFPRFALPAAIREYAEAMAAALPCPFEFVAVAALGAASAAIGNSCHLRLKPTWTTSGQLWLAIVCDPGTKKSPALNMATRPLHLAQAQYFRDFAEAGGGKEPGADGEVPLRQILTTDTSRRGLIELLAENPRGVTLVADELLSWTTDFKQGDESFWLSVWSGTQTVVNRGPRHQRRSYIPAPFVSVVGCLPTGSITRLNRQRFRDSGFLDRILFAWVEPERQGWSESDPEPSIVAAYDELFGKLLALDLKQDDGGAPQPVLLDFTPAGKKAWLAFLEDLHHGMDGEQLPSVLRGAWSKMEGYAARLALVVHLVRWVMGETLERDVDEVSMGSAAALIQYFQGGACRVRGADESSVNPDVQAVTEWIRRHRQEIVAKGDRFRWQALRHDLHNRFARRPDDLRAAIDRLVDQNRLVPIDLAQKKRGRPAEPTYEVLWSAFL